MRVRLPHQLHVPLLGLKAAPKWEQSKLSVSSISIDVLDQSKWVRISCTLILVLGSKTADQDTLEITIYLKFKPDFVVVQFLQWWVKLCSYLAFLNWIGLFNRHLLRFYDCLGHPNLSATLATDQKWPLSHLHTA